MKVLVDIGHPAHVHFYKYFIAEMKKRGHAVLVTARDKDLSHLLLERYGIDFIPVGRMGGGKLRLLSEWLMRDWKIFRLARTFRPDVLTGIHNPCAAHAALLLGGASIIFGDTEHAKLQNVLTYPLANVAVTSSAYKIDMGKKHVRYEGFHELAYLHPNRFTPDPAVLGLLGLQPGEKYSIVRFVSWGASHDIGQRGLDSDFKLAILRELEKHGRVFLFGEGSQLPELEKYHPDFPPERIHDLLAFATLYIGEGATMASEAALLGVPAIFISTLSGTLGYLEEMERDYDLLYSFRDQARALEKALELLRRPDLLEAWQEKRRRILADKVDVTAFMVDFVENYPRSFRDYRSNTAQGKTAS